MSCSSVTHAEVWLTCGHVWKGVPSSGTVLLHQCIKERLVTEGTDMDMQPADMHTAAVDGADHTHITTDF